MVSAFDNRIIKLGLEINGEVQTFENYAILARGSKYANGILNECECRIYNLGREKRNYLLSETSPFALGTRTAKLMTLDVGRESYGTFRLFQGNIIASNPTQPPDIGITFRSLTGAFLMGNIMPMNQPALSKLSTIAAAVAENTNTTLQFHATDKNIGNFSYTGASLNQVNKLGEVGGVDAYIDNDILTVKNQGQSIPGEPRLISLNTGMIGVPEVDEFGVRVRIMLDNSVKLGSQVTIQSDINQQANGTFTVYKMDFEIATRSSEFYYILYCSNYVFPTL